MLFSSTTFIFLFLPFVIAIYYTLLRNKRNKQNIFLFFVSILFYAWGEPIFALIMLLSIVVNYCFGLIIGRNRENSRLQKYALVMTVIFNVAILFIFKYLSFAMLNINHVFETTIKVPEIALPLGISFFTFQAMSYVIDVYRGEKHQERMLNVGLYITFFPQLIAGPIVRYETVAYQINHRQENFDDFSEGVVRFIIGLGKKVLLANTMAVVADTFFNCEPSSLSVASAWVGAIAYSFQIFFDFSGYSDMAIGLGRMFGFHFLENFNYPYISSSITEFWRRWHMSLGTWFRDYLYFPLGGSRVDKKSRAIFNLLVVWFLTGVWHGANWTFIIWGLMYFVLLTIEKLTGIHKSSRFAFVRHVYTLLFVVLGWVIFRANSMDSALQYISVMFGQAQVLVDNSAIFYIKENVVCFVIAIIASTPVVKMLCDKYKHHKLGQIAATLSLLVMFLLSVIYIVKGTYNPFIYFNF